MAGRYDVSARDVLHPGKFFVRVEGQAQIAAGHTVSMVWTGRSVTAPGAGIRKSADILRTATQAEPFSGEAALSVGHHVLGQAHPLDGLCVTVNTDAVAPILPGRRATSQKEKQSAGELMDALLHA